VRSSIRSNGTAGGVLGMAFPACGRSGRRRCRMGIRRRPARLVPTFVFDAPLDQSAPFHPSTSAAFRFT
jgi:hypothetical protein